MELLTAKTLCKNHIEIVKKKKKRLFILTCRFTIIKSIKMYFLNLNKTVVLKQIFFYYF